MEAISRHTVRQGLNYTDVLRKSGTEEVDPSVKTKIGLFKVEKYNSVMGECPRFSALGYVYPCTVGTGFGTRAPGEALIAESEVRLQGDPAASFSVI